MNKALQFINTIKTTTSTRERESAFGGLYNMFQTPLRNYLRRFERNPDALEDLLQVSLTKALNNLDTFDGSHKISTWVFRIAHNTMIDATRRRQLDTISMSVTMDYDTESILPMLLPCSNNNPLQEMEAQEQATLCHDVVNKIPHDVQRECLKMRYFKGFSYKEIAAELDLPLGTVKASVNRAKQWMAQFLTQKQQELEFEMH